MNVDSDPAELARLAASKLAENLDFRRHLRRRSTSIEPFQVLATAIAERTDCTACGNCCRLFTVEISAEEIKAVAAYMGMSADEVLIKHTDPDPGDSSRRVIRNEDDSCTFLDNGLCMVYEVRPKPCREFPHVAVGAHSLGARFESVCLHSSVCPILYEAIEQYKGHTGYRPAK